MGWSPAHRLSYGGPSGTHMLALPGVQDETEYFKRKGYPRFVGFGVLRYEIKKGKFRHYSPSVVMV